jgi:anti-sigma factor RsiW
MAEANRKQYMNTRPFAFTECPLISGEENADILLDYCNRKLDPALAELFEQHMESCAACRAFSESQSAVWNALDAFEAMPISPDFDRRLFERIERDEQRSWWTRLRNRLALSGTSIWKPAIPIAALALLAAGIWMRPAPTSIEVIEPTKMATMDRVDPEQIDAAVEDMEMLRQVGVVEAAQEL